MLSFFAKHHNAMKTPRWRFRLSLCFSLSQRFSKTQGFDRYDGAFKRTKNNTQYYSHIPLFYLLLLGVFNVYVRVFYMYICTYVIGYLSHSLFIVLSLLFHNLIKGLIFSEISFFPKTKLCLSFMLNSLK